MKLGKKFLLFIIVVFALTGCTLQKPRIRKIYDCLPGTTNKKYCTLIRVKCDRGVAYSVCASMKRFHKVDRMWGDRGIQDIGGH